MALRRHFVPDVPDFSVLANPVSHAHDAEKGPAQKTLHPARAVSFDDFELFVRQQRKIQVVLLLEFRKQLLAVGAAAQNRGIRPFEFPLRVAKLGRFVRSTRRQRLREKIEDHVLAAIVGQRDFPAVVGGHAKFRRACSGFKWFRHLPFPSALLEQSS